MAGSPAVSSTRARASLLLEGAQRRQEHIVSPEGVPLTVEVASYGDRLAAFMLDSLFWTVATFLVVLAVLLVFGHLGSSFMLTFSIAVFLAFLIRNLYMIHFELFWRGAHSGSAFASGSGWCSSSCCRSSIASGSGLGI